MRLRYARGSTRSRLLSSSVSLSFPLAARPPALPPSVRPSVCARQHTVGAFSLRAAANEFATLFAYVTTLLSLSLSLSLSLCLSLLCGSLADFGGVPNQVAEMTSPAACFEE